MQLPASIHNWVPSESPFARERGKMETDGNPRVFDAADAFLALPAEEAYRLYFDKMMLEVGTGLEGLATASGIDLPEQGRFTVTIEPEDMMWFLALRGCYTLGEVPFEDFAAAFAGPVLDEPDARALVDAVGDLRIGEAEDRFFGRGRFFRETTADGPNYEDWVVSKYAEELIRRRPDPAPSP